MTGIEKLLAAEEGSATAVAAKLTTPERPCYRQLVEYWKSRGYVTGTWPLHVHNVYQIPLHDLNPSIYPNTAV
jgi:hypothetical protein